MFGGIAAGGGVAAGSTAGAGGGGAAGGGVSTLIAMLEVATAIGTARIGAAVAATGGTEVIVLGGPSVMRDKALANASGTPRSCPLESLVMV
jgi:hypothetical protein